MCGRGGLVPWSPSKHDVGYCFQQIFVLVPVLILFAIVSAYYYGSRSERRTSARHQKCIIHFRFTFTVFIAIIPIIKFFVGMLYTTGMFRPVDYLSAGVEIITWFVHAGYVLSLRHDDNVQGPILVRVLWTLLVVLSITNLRTQILTSDENSEIVYHLNFGFCVALIVLEVLYGLTFLPFIGPSEPNLTLIRRQSHFSERSHLLRPSVYHGFIEDIDPGYLGVAMEDESVLSKLIFHWVYALMKKGNFIGITLI